MGFDWFFALMSLTGGSVLLIGTYLTRCYEKTIFAPATAMLFTWGVALVILSFLPLIGFYHLSAEAVVLYVLGSGWFAIITLLTSFIMTRLTKKNETHQFYALEHLNYTHLVYFWSFISLASYPLAYFDILSYGSNLVEITYNIRRTMVSGGSVLNPVLSNVFVVVGVLTNIVLYGVIKKKVNLTTFLILSVPFLFISLVINGRSGLVSLVLGWLVIVSVFSGRIKLSTLLLPIALLLSIIFFGGVFVKKFDVEDKTAGDALSILLEHVFSYLYQGPILFSRYFNDEIDVAANWDFLNSVCHVIAKLDLCVPRGQHSEFVNYGTEQSGNVYSIYFSIIPHYGILGLFVVFFAYAVFLAVLFHKLKSASVFAVVVYPLMFSAIALSVFSDSIGYAFYWLLKVIIIVAMINLFFSIRKKRITIS